MMTWKDRKGNEEKRFDQVKEEKDKEKPELLGEKVENKDQL